MEFFTNLCVNVMNVFHVVTINRCVKNHDCVHILITFSIALALLLLQFVFFKKEKTYRYIIGKHTRSNKPVSVIVNMKKYKKHINNFVFSKSSSKSNNISDIKKFTAVIKNRRKYPFILNPKPLIPTKFKDLPPSVLKMNNKFVNLLRIENEKTFINFFLF